MNEFQKNAYLENFEYLIKEILGEMVELTQKEKTKDSDVVENDILLNGVPYTIYVSTLGKSLIIPKNFNTKNNFLPIYSVGGNEFGFAFTAIQKEEDILEYINYLFKPISIYDSEAVECSIHYHSGVVETSGIDELLENAKLNDSYFPSFYEMSNILKSDDIKHQIINIFRNKKNTKKHLYELGDTTKDIEIFNVIMNKKIPYEIINDNQTPLMKLAIEELKKLKQNKIKKIEL